MAEIDYSKGKIPGAESGIEIRHSCLLYTSDAADEL